MENGQYRGNTWNSPHPAITLFLIAPLVGEVLPGVRPIATIFNPLTFLLLSTLYGSGALIVRELTVRWNKGWPSIILLGFAYGILEEGIGAQSFTNPLWSGLDDPSGYSRLWGINWVWAEQILIYHALISISLSILIVNLLYPSKQSERYLSGKTLIACFAIIALNLLFQELILLPYWSGTSFYIIAMLVVLILGLMARFAPRSVHFRRKFKAPNWLVFLFTAILAFVFVLEIQYSLYKSVPPLLDIILTTVFLIFVFTAFSFLAPKNTSGSWLYAVALGPVVFFIVINSLIVPPSIPGELLFAVIIVVAGIRVLKHDRRATGAEESAAT